MANWLRAIRSLAIWVWDWVIEHWPAIVAASGGAVMTYLASLSKALEPYGAVGWGAVGLATVFILAIAIILISWGVRIRVRARYDAKFLENGSPVNPLDIVFERKRIILDQFVLPSFAYVDGKTFIDCDFIGPGCVYLFSGNQAIETRPPRVDAVWLAPDANFLNGITFRNCHFRRCSFQRITFFCGLENHATWHNNPHGNWIGIPPTQEHVKQRMTAISGPPPGAATSAPIAATAPATVIEGASPAPNHNEHT